MVPAQISVFLTMDNLPVREGGRALNLEAAPQVVGATTDDDSLLAGGRETPARACRLADLPSGRAG